VSATHPHTDTSFSIDIEPERDVVRVCPSGEVDMATAGEVRTRIDELLDRGFTRVALDLRGITFLDSTGVRLVLELTAAASADGWELAVVRGPAPVSRVFELTGVESLVPFVDPAQARSLSTGWAWR